MHIIKIIFPNIFSIFFLVLYPSNPNFILVAWESPVFLSSPSTYSYHQLYNHLKSCKLCLLNLFLFWIFVLYCLWIDLCFLGLFHFSKFIMNVLIFDFDSNCISEYRIEHRERSNYTNSINTIGSRIGKDLIILARSILDCVFELGIRKSLHFRGKFGIRVFCHKLTLLTSLPV